MSDKTIVTWDEPKLPNRPAGAYGSFSEMFAKAVAISEEQQAAQEYLKKSMPAMIALLEYKLKHNEPLIVMRPLTYQGSDIEKSDEIEDSFYNRRSDERVNSKFVDISKTIWPGTSLVLKALDPTLQEFIFVDALNNEHAINYADRDKLLTQTNVFEETRIFLEGQR